MKPVLAAVTLALTLAVAIARPAVASPATDLARSADALRLAGAMGAAPLIKVLPADDLEAAWPLVRVGMRSDGALLADFLAQSGQRIFVSGDDGVVGWWNPMADAWVVSLWRQGQGGWRLTQVGALLGDELASAAPTALPVLTPAWIGRNPSLIQALADQHRQGVDRFRMALRSGAAAAVLADSARQKRAWTILLGRQGAMRMGLALIGGPLGVAGARRTVEEILVADTAGRVADPDARQMLAAMPEPVRVSLRPVMVVREPGGLAVLAASPIAPGFIVLTHIPDDRADIARIETISLFAKEHP